VTYGGKTWTLTLTDENALRLSEREILRNIYGPVLEIGKFKICYNEELNELIKGEGIVRYNIYNKEERKTQVEMVGGCI
jgi:hypothetical protein